MKKKMEPVELVGWQEVADKLKRSVRDAQVFVAENPSFPVIRNGKGAPVRASIRRVEAWLERYHAAFEEWNRRQQFGHPEMVLTKFSRFVYRPAEPPSVDDIQGRG